MSPRDIAKLRELKAELQREFGERPWFRGAGIGVADGQPLLRLNVDEREIGEDEIPAEWRGCPVEVVFIHGYEKR